MDKDVGGTRARAKSVNYFSKQKNDDQNAKINNSALNLAHQLKVVDNNSQDNLIYKKQQNENNESQNAKNEDENSDNTSKTIKNDFYIGDERNFKAAHERIERNNKARNNNNPNSENKNNNKEPVSNKEKINVDQKAAAKKNDSNQDEIKISDIKSSLHNPIIENENPEDDDKQDNDNKSDAQLLKDLEELSKAASEEYDNPSRIDNMFNDFKFGIEKKNKSLEKIEREVKKEKRKINNRKNNILKDIVNNKGKIDKELKSNKSDDISI